MPEICESDVVKPCLLDDLVMHPAHHLWRVGPLRGRMHEHQRTVWMLGVFHDQEVDHLRCQGYCSRFRAIFDQFPPFYRALLRYGQRPIFYIEVAPFQGD